MDGWMNEMGCGYESGIGLDKMARRDGTGLVERMADGE
jgi:hypothetical protein